MLQDRNTFDLLKAAKVIIQSVSCSHSVMQCLHFANYDHKTCRELIYAFLVWH